MTRNIETNGKEILFFFILLLLAKEVENIRKIMDFIIRRLEGGCKSNLLNLLGLIGPDNTNWSRHIVYIFLLYSLIFSVYILEFIYSPVQCNRCYLQLKQLL